MSARRQGDSPTDSPEPPSDCPLCPRLAAFRALWRAREPDWWNAPIPVFGESPARGLVVGLAPGLRGANRTGRAFTGDYAGDLLYATLLKFGLAEGQFLARPDDGLRLKGIAVVNAVRCVPPDNKPIGAEIATCRRFLIPHLAPVDGASPIAILALGRIAHDSVVRGLGWRLKDAPFAHGAEHMLGGVTLLSSYHCSRYNTNTGVLTTPMFEAVVARFATHLGA